MRRPSAGALLLLTIALAGCGSTVQQQGATSAGSGQALSAPGAAVDPLTGAPLPAADVPGIAAPGGAPGTVGIPGAGGATTERSGTTAGLGSSTGSTGSSGSTGAAGPVPAGGTAAGTTSGRRGPGVTDKTVTLGFQYVDVGTGTGAVLGEDVSLGDPQAQAKAVQKWINENGGMGGKKLELVYYGAPYANYVNNPQAEYNKICTYFTEDHKVLGVAVYVPDETLARCLARRDVISVANGYSLDRKVYDDLSAHYYSPGSMSQDRGAQVGVAGLHGAGFFKDAKIGLLRYDTAVYKRAEVTLKRALATKGLAVAETFQVSASDTSTATRDAGAAVLKFRQEGVTHVMALDNSGGILFAFMNAAENQGYRPFYGLTTNNAPNGLRELAPAKQLEKATAVSWWWGDVGNDAGNKKHQTPPALPSSLNLCLKIMQDAGVDLSGRAATGSATITCDQLLFLKTLTDRSGAPHSADMRVAADALGSSYSSPITYASSFGPGRHDAARVTRLIRYDAACTCFRYAGPGPTAP
jgi:ABC-type branched-subunit amino acid transport system substrate-binding protein